LATAGSGDVLTGIIAGLGGSNLSPLIAAALGAFIHGAAGELGDFGVIADELPYLARTIEQNILKSSIF
jgi:NAD(P)H-hydrate epimerase